MRLLFSDSFSPLSGIFYQLIALGRTSGVKSDLDRDMHLSKELPLDENGELAVDDPRFAEGFRVAGGNVQSKRPNAIEWEGVPGLPIPGQPGRIIRYGIATNPKYPVIPVVVRVFDIRVTPTPRDYPLLPGETVTSFKRPEIATLNGKVFDNTIDYLNHLPAAFSANASAAPHLYLSNTRIGDDGPLQPVFMKLRLAFDPGSADDAAGSRNAVRSRDTVPLRVFQALAGELGFPSAKNPADLPAGYASALRAIASLARAEVKLYANSPQLMRLLNAVSVPMGGSKTFISSLYEDYASLGTAVFLLGLVTRGYRWGTVGYPAAAMFSRLEVALTAALSASEKDTKIYQLIKP